MFLLLLLSFALSPRVEGGEIIGGHEARPHSRPYMAYLNTYNKNSGQMFQCGGFLIRKDVVLTAAHCHESLINVTLGAHNIQQPEETWQKISVLKTILHPNFKYKKFSNDIMLLKLQRNARLTKEVGLLKLPDSQIQMRPGQVCSAAGWGKVKPKANLSDRLLEVEMIVQENAKCKRRYRNYNGTTQLCIGDPKERKGTLMGDSGGPLVCNNVAQGIISYGKKNGKPPRVCTRITNFLPWIKNTLRKM
ncbi:granzyme B-like [Suncus etruscus]|uniref:granzyme B-like n=1 Tax=Suncus etruscus TaxID=109475 RepID=UPI00211029B1|nr:granzyme B-like [Suncus etruscus]